MYSNSKNQISLEEAYRKVHQEPKKKDCCSACKKGKSCECEDDHEVKQESIDLAYATARDIVANADSGVSELTRFLPIVLGAATVALGVYRERAADIVAGLMERINVKTIADNISELEQQKQSLEKEAKHNIEAQVKLNKVIDDILEEGTYEALDQLYKSEHGLPPSKIVKALRKKLEERLNERK